MGKLTKSEISDYQYNNIIRVVLYLAYILIGTVVYNKSYIGYNTITKAFALIFIITGVVYVWMSGKEKKLNLSNLDVIFGILASLSGLLMIINPGSMQNNLTFYYGIFLAVCFMQKLVVAIKLFKIKDNVAPITLFSAILILILAVFMMFNFFGNVNLTEISALFAIFFGVIQLTSTSLINRHENNIIKKN